MLNFNKRRILAVLLMIMVVVINPMTSWAAFDSLINSGKDIFTGLREIIYPASAVGIIAVCMGGFFGNINWKWLTAIVVGLVVISCCVAFVQMFAPDAVKSIPKDIMNGS